MNENVKVVAEQRLQRVLSALEKNGIPAHYAKDIPSAIGIVKDILHKGALVSCGGSMTLQESGIRKLLANGDYRFLDRDNANVDREEIYRQTFGCDVYLTSANAITEAGELYHVDGNGNRVAAITYGPKKVIVVAGRNKIVRDINEAVYRVKNIAAPSIAVRAGRDTPCRKTGQCIVPDGSMSDGCDSAARMCLHFSIIGNQGKRNKGRIQVVLVNEDLGF